jgi:hypothetical protein
MNKTLRSMALIGMIGALTMSFTGCGSSDSATNTADKNGTEKTTESDAATTTSTVANQPQVVEPGNNLPSQTVAIFLDSLRRGDEAAANSMLTARALSEIQKTDYVIQPLGTREGDFKVGRLGFPYPDQQNVALVESQWREPATKTEPEFTMDIVCEVHQEANGWRIAGMAVSVVGENEPPLVVDFEDGPRLQELLKMANGQGPSVQTSTQNLQQVGQPGLQQLGQPGLQQTGLPQLGQQPAQQPFGQQQQPMAQQPTQQGFQPDAGLNSLPPLPQLPSNGTQIAVPPGKNVLR